MEFTSVVAAATQGAAALKSAIDLARQSGKSELVEDLMTARLKMLDLVEENAALRTRNRELEAAARIRGALEVAHNSYWLRDEAGKLDGPFCMSCWDQAGKLGRREHSGCDLDVDEWFDCVTCKSGTVIIPRRFCEENGVVWYRKDTAASLRASSLGA
jgi:hypothetical protein